MIRWLVDLEDYGEDAQVAHAYTIDGLSPFVALCGVGQVPFCLKLWTAHDSAGRFPLCVVCRRHILRPEAPARVLSRLEAGRARFAKDGGEAPAPTSSDVLARLGYASSSASALSSAVCASPAAADASDRRLRARARAPRGRAAQ